MRIKRATDIALATIGLVLVSPVLAAAAFAIRVRMGSPVLFRQTRTGMNGELFTLIKFRTMTNSAGSDGELLSDDARITRLGRFLRETSIDELPELFNVLRGDMSLVGPRPLLPEYLPRYSAEQARRHEVPAGLTGLAQVSGRNELAWDDRFALDVEYVDTRSLRLDLQILARTVLAALRRENIGHRGELTSPEFSGNEGSEKAIATP